MKQGQDELNYGKIVKHLFELFFNKLYPGANREIKLDAEHPMRMIATFQKALSKNFPLPSIDICFLVNYFAWAFQYWSTKELEKRKRIELAWIIGPKMVKAYATRNKDSDYYVREFLMQLSIVIDDEIYLLANYRGNALGLSPAEEVMKAMFQDGDAKFYNCIMHTTLWHPLSQICWFCEHKKDCKDLLKNTKLYLYTPRIKEENATNAKVKS